jgi:hypothetical protein
MTLSPEQFDPDPDSAPGWYRETYSWDRFGTSRYKYLSNVEDMTGSGYVGEGLSILVHPQSETPNFAQYANNPQYPDIPSYQAIHGRRDGEPSDELFTHNPAKVASAFTGRATRSQVMTGLALANNDAYPGGGRLMTYDSDLSKHSSRLVGNLRKRGLDIPVNEDNPDAIKTNSYSLDDYDAIGHQISVDMDFAERVPSEKVAAAKKTVRSILRSEPSAPKSALPLSPIKDDAVRAGIAGGWVYPENDEERKPPTPVPGQLSLF